MDIDMNKRFDRRIDTALITIGLFIVIAGCDSREDRGAKSTPPPAFDVERWSERLETVDPQDTKNDPYQVRGRVNDVTIIRNRPDLYSLLVIDIEAIPEYRNEAGEEMGLMAKDYLFSVPEELNPSLEILEPGDIIRFTFWKQNKPFHLLITSFEKLPDDTTLELRQ